MSKFEKIVSTSEGRFYIDSENKTINPANTSSQGSYNIPHEFLMFASEHGVIHTDSLFEYSRKDKDGPAYVLSDDYSLKLGRGVLWLIGTEYDEKSNRFIASIGVTNGKFQLFRTVYNKLNKDEYGWFVALYDKNLQGNKVILSIDEDKKELIIDLEFTTVKSSIEKSKIEASESQDKNSKKSDFAFNRLIFGAPGTGKSRLLEEDRKSSFGSNYERVTFYEDYSYSQFVGTYKPVMGTGIEYKFIPGPFLRLLKKAIKAKFDGIDEKYLLIIEELNRGSAASVFGDMFQLLDRDENGEGEYELHLSEDVKKYFASEGLNIDKIKLPNNFYLWATMNTADQGVTPLDAAFKRRFDEYKLMDINENEDIIDSIDVTIKCNDIGTVKWNIVRHAINDILLADGAKDDKLIGPFFIKPNILKNHELFKNAFKDKLLMYLLEDVVKRNNSLFEVSTLTAINDNYNIKNGSGKIFSEKFMKILIDKINKDTKTNESINPYDNILQDESSDASS